MSYTDEQVERIFGLMDVVLKHATGKFSDYAKTYAKASMEAYMVYGDEGLGMQIPYVLANLQNWRGDLARKTKAELRDFYRFTL